MSLSFEILKALRSEQMNFASLKILLLWQLKREFKNKRLLFYHNKKSVSPIFLQNLILPAVAIKLYCFKLLFEHHFCFKNRPFVFSLIDNFDSGCHSNKI